jgi:hypothetical protein
MRGTVWLAGTAPFAVFGHSCERVRLAVRWQSLVDQAPTVRARVGPFPSLAGGRDFRILELFPWARAFITCKVGSRVRDSLNFPPVCLW